MEPRAGSCRSSTASAVGTLVQVSNSLSPETESTLRGIWPCKFSGAKKGLASGYKKSSKTSEAQTNRGLYQGSHCQERCANQAGQGVGMFRGRADAGTHQVLGLLLRRSSHTLRRRLLARVFGSLCDQRAMALAQILEVCIHLVLLQVADREQHRRQLLSSLARLGRAAPGL